MRYGFVVMLLCLLSACVFHKTNESMQSTTMIRHYHLPAVQAVTVLGATDLELHTGSRATEISIRAPQATLDQIEVRIRHGRLLVMIPNSKVRGISVSITVPRLNALTYNGVGMVRATNIRAPNLILDVSNTGNTEISGNIGLRKVVQHRGVMQVHGIDSRHLDVKVSASGRLELVGRIQLASMDLSEDSFLSMYWVKGNTLRVRGKGNTTIQLAGVTKMLDVELWDKARFNGRYLRAHEAYVKTHNNAIAEMSAIKRQHTLASDASDIYFYNVPPIKTDFMAFNGVVLDLRQWTKFVSRDVYTEYNR
ncbi:MAG: DUF2807 domain-containing protein [Legionellaceae bacterium]|nr:DUF2807 domain-containing protein [Legionellaceae bacterium]